MKKVILNITGYWERNGQHDFSTAQSWKGNILVKPDLTFEGIVVDEGITDDKYLIGSLVDLKGITLMKFANSGHDSVGFYGFANGDKINGTVAVYSLLTGFNLLGNCQIELSVLEYSEDMQLGLEKQIEAFRKNSSKLNKQLIAEVISSLGETVDCMLNDIEHNDPALQQQTGYQIKPLSLPIQVPERI